MYYWIENFTFPHYIHEIGNRCNLSLGINQLNLDPTFLLVRKVELINHIRLSGELHNNWSVSQNSTDHINSLIVSLYPKRNRRFNHESTTIEDFLNVNSHGIFQRYYPNKHRLKKNYGSNGGSLRSGNPGILGSCGSGPKPNGNCGRDEESWETVVG